MEIIEIPFGAKDSELQEWIYTIPKGMKAEIRDGKVIIKRKESEDERIRKAILGLTYLDGIEPILTKCSVTAQDIRKYLEKQKEQTTLEYLPKEKINDIIDKLTDLSYSKLIPFKSRESQKIDEISTDILGFLDYPIEQQKEQKPETKLTGWVARDSEHNSYSGLGLVLFIEKPRRTGDCWSGEIATQLSWELFPDLKWEDEPVEVELTIRRK